MCRFLKFVFCVVCLGLCAVSCLKARDVALSAVMVNIVTKICRLLVLNRRLSRASLLK